MLRTGLALSLAMTTACADEAPPPPEFSAELALTYTIVVGARVQKLEVEGKESALWTLRDGRVVRYAWFHGSADALEAAGLEE